MVGQPFEPGQLVIELGTRLRISIRQVKRGNHDSVDRCFDVAAMGVFVAARQAAPVLERVGAASEDCDTVPGFLPMPDCAIPCGVYGHDRAGVLKSLEFLKADDVRLFAFQPLEQIGKARTNPVDVKSRYFQRDSSLMKAARSSKQPNRKAAMEAVRARFHSSLGKVARSVKLFTHGTVIVQDLLWPQTVVVTVHVPGAGLGPEF